MFNKIKEIFTLRKIKSLVLKQNIIKYRKIEYKLRRHLIPYIIDRIRENW